jgi:chromate transporter
MPDCAEPRSCLLRPGVLLEVPPPAITGSVVVLAKRSIIDIPTVLIAVVTIALLWKFTKLPEPVIIAGAAIIGLMVYPMLHV